MTRLTSVITAIIILSSQIFAQEDTTARKHSLYKGMWALQFQIDGLINNIRLSDFQGTGISIKKHLTNESAIRLGLSIGTSISTSDEDNYLSDTTLPTKTADDHWYSLNIRTQYLHYLTEYSDVKVYLGVGPQINYQWSKREYSSNVSWTKYYSVAFGMSGAVGAEIFITRWISGHVETGASIEYKWEENKSTVYGGIRETKRKYFIFSPSSVKLGISLYF
ncbi:MAG: hypothetical protein HZB59_01955 [Ignavibacteriales bacterium]|nr:hypothetical protein [Ignavibacteriales bacterium]